MKLKLARQNVADLKAKLAKAKKDRAAIGEAALTEQRALTDEDRTKRADATKAIEVLEAQLEDAEAILADAEAANEAERSASVPAPDPDHVLARGAAAGLEARTISVGREAAADDPMRGFRSPREFLTCVMTAAQGRPDPRLAPLQAAVGSDEQSTFSDPYGGYLVPVGMAPNLLSLEAEADPVASLVTRIPMTAPSIMINARTDKNHTTSVSGGLTVTRREQAVDITSSRMEFERITLRSYGLFGLAYATEEILTDSPQSFVAILEAGFRDEFAAKLLDERLNGTGAGEFTGVIAAPCVVSQAKETGQTADTIVKENIDKMVSRCWRYGRSVWLANHDTVPQLLSLKQDVGTGGAPVMYFQGNVGGQATLLGRPISFTEFCPKLGDNGDILLGVWSEYLESTYQSIQQAESIHVRFVQHERAVKFWLRNDGQPWWRAALTPKKSSQTLSPFVTLAAR